MENLTKCYCGHTTTCDCGPEEPKQEDMITKIMQMDAKMAYDSLPKQDKQMTQETLEEAANKLLWKKYPYHPPKDAGYWKDMFKEGAEWQQKNSNVNALDFEIDSLKREIKLLKHEQERSYSEEELLNKLTHFAVEIQRQNKQGIVPLRIKEWFERNKKK